MSAVLHKVLRYKTGPMGWQGKAHDFDESKVKRSHGQFSSTAGSSGNPEKPAGKKVRKPRKEIRRKGQKVKEVTADPNRAKGRPSKPDERDPDAAPPALPEKRPPPRPTGQSKAPRNAEDRPVTGYAANGIANTYFGDLVENALEKIGLRNILPEGKRSHAPGEVAEKGSSLDREYDHSGDFFEVKAVCVEGQEFKAKPKASELEGKRRFADIHEGRGNTMVVVVDTDNGEAHAYWRPALGAFAINPDDLGEWNYAGTVEMDSAVIDEARKKTEEGKAKREAMKAAQGTGVA